jgi:hypothetical protein
MFNKKAFARGLTMGKDFNPHIAGVMRPFWETCGEALRGFNKIIVEDPRIDVLLLPLFDGVTQIKWNQDYLAETTNGVANRAANGSA